MLTENKIIPDIRPAKMETIEETYTTINENGEQENVTENYKLISISPIINGILDKLTFFRTHASAVWYNRLAGITVKDKLDDLSASLDETKKSVADGKALIASALTSKGITTASTATFSTMATNIKSLYKPPQSESGQINRISIAASGEASGTVTFTTAFGTTPTIQMTCYKAVKGDESNLSTSYYTITITARTKTAFSYKIKSSYTSKSTGSFQWNAST